MCMHTNACIYYMHQCVPVPSEDMSDVLELDLQKIMSYPVWVLGLEPGSFAKAASALPNC